MAGASWQGSGVAAGDSNPWTVGDCAIEEFAFTASVLLSDATFICLFLVVPDLCENYDFSKTCDEGLCKISTRVLMLLVHL